MEPITFIIYIFTIKDETSSSFATFKNISESLLYPQDKWNTLLGLY